MGDPFTVNIHQMANLLAHAGGKEIRGILVEKSFL